MQGALHKLFDHFAGALDAGPQPGKERGDE
jgi:hypothetical protein